MERAFGVLQDHFAIVRGPACFWDKATVRDIMTACIIMHNMIVEDECNEQEDFRYDGVGQLVHPSPREVHNRTHEFHEFIQAHHEIEMSKLTLNFGMISSNTSRVFMVICISYLTSLVLPFLQSAGKIP